MLLLGVLICECFAHARTLLFLHCTCHMSLTAAFRLCRKEKKRASCMFALFQPPPCAARRCHEPDCGACRATSFTCVCCPWPCTGVTGLSLRTLLPAGLAGCGSPGGFPSARRSLMTSSSSRLIVVGSIARSLRRCCCNVYAKNYVSRSVCARPCDVLLQMAAAEQRNFTLEDLTAPFPISLVPTF